MTEKEIEQKFHDEYGTPKDENYAIEYDAYMAGAKAVQSRLPTEGEIKRVVQRALLISPLCMALDSTVQESEAFYALAAKMITSLLKGGSK